MDTLLAATRTYTNRVLEFLLGTRLAPVRAQASDPHLHWDRVVRAWRIIS
jgi:hypothetical protein